MTKTENAAILKLCKIGWPHSFERMTPDEMADTLTLWADLFADDDFNEVAAAVKRIMLAGNREFAPNVGAIKEEMRRMFNKDRLTPTAAWELVRKALQNSVYGFEEEYGKLPPDVQEAVGSPGRLRVMALMDADEVEKYEAPRFQRDFAAVQKEKDTQAKLPEGLRPANELPSA